MYDTSTEALQTLGDLPQNVDTEMEVKERFTVVLYDHTSSAGEVILARKVLFSQCGRTIENIPPTQAALLQHIKRAAYQAGYIWSPAIIGEPHLPSPGDGGWKLKTCLKNQLSSRNYFDVGAKKGSKGHCRCLRADLSCTASCFCWGTKWVIPP